MMARRISGSQGCGGGPLPASFSPPPRRPQGPVLRVGEGNAGHQRVPVQAGPGPALEVAEAEFLFELLVRLFANPARLDGGGQGTQRGPRRQVCEVVFALPARAPLADQPDLIAGQVAVVRPSLAVADPDAGCREPC